MTETLQAEIEQITESVCETLLDVKVSVRESGAPDAGGSVARQVRIKGEWNGSVTVECSELLARRAAGAAFAIDPAKASAEDIQDVVGEIANQVGGNIKALLPGPTTLSLPKERDPVASKACCVVAFDAEGEGLKVLVAEERE